MSTHILSHCEPITPESIYIKNEQNQSNQESQSNTSTCESIDNEDKSELVIQTFRFKFSHEFTEEMSHFAKIHQFDDRIAFKEAWKVWTEEIYITSLINAERKVLSVQGYEGDVLDKMFKSARYYYRKKKPEPNEAIPRKEYIGVSSKILECMDSYIKTQFLENTVKTKDNIIKTTISPANAYTDFNTIHKLQIEEEIEKIHIYQEEHQQCKLDAKEIAIKFKKTFKNRYFIQSKNNTLNYEHSNSS